MLKIRDKEGLSLRGREDRWGCVRRICVRRGVGRGCSVEM